MQTVRTLIVYFSRTGMTKKVAQAIAKEIPAEIIRLESKRYPKGSSGFMRALVDSILRKAIPIENQLPDPVYYDLVIVGSPIWNTTVAGPVRTFLKTVGYSPTRIAFFLTYDGSGRKKIFEEMEELCGKTPIAKMEVSAEQLSTNSIQGKVGDFARQIQEFFDKPAYSRKPPRIPPKPKDSPVSPTL